MSVSPHTGADRIIALLVLNVRESLVSAEVKALALLALCVHLPQRQDGLQRQEARGGRGNFPQPRGAGSV